MQLLSDHSALAVHQVWGRQDRFPPQGLPFQDFIIACKKNDTWVFNQAPDILVSLEVTTFNSLYVTILCFNYFCIIKISFMGAGEFSCLECITNVWKNTLLYIINNYLFSERISVINTCIFPSQLN